MIVKCQLYSDLPLLERLLASDNRNCSCACRTLNAFTVTKSRHLPCTFLRQAYNVFCNTFINNFGLPTLFSGTFPAAPVHFHHNQNSNKTTITIIQT